MRLPQDHRMVEFDLQCGNGNCGTTLEGQNMDRKCAWHKRL
jgi:hypothetical protein